MEEMKEKIIVNMKYLIGLVENQLDDQEILKGYMLYYFAQARTLFNLKDDLIFRLDKMIFGKYEAEQYRAAIENVRRVLKDFLKEKFNVSESMIKLD